MDNGTFFSIFLGWFIFSLVAGTIASRKGRPGPLYFLLALALSPVVGIVVALAAAPNVPQLERKAIRSGRGKKCPFCAEIIKTEARACRYCGRDVSAASSVEQPIYLSKGDGEQHGPFTRSQIHTMLRADAAWTHVWYDGLTAWKPVSDFPQFFNPGIRTHDIDSSAVTSLFMWLYSLAPLSFFLFLLLGIPGWWPAWGFYAMGALLIVPEWIDKALLKRAGLQPPSGSKDWFPPQYAYHRAKRLGHDLSYFWISALTWGGFALYLLYLLVKAL